MPIATKARLALGLIGLLLTATPSARSQTAELLEPELSLVLPILPRQVDAPGQANFPRLLPHQVSVRTAEPSNVTILVGSRLPEPTPEGLLLDPATVRTLAYGHTVGSLSNSSLEDPEFEFRSLLRVPHDLPPQANLAIQAVSVPTPALGAATRSNRPTFSGTIGLRTVDGAWVDPSAASSSWVSGDTFGTRCWTGPIGGLPRSGDVDLLLSVSLSGGPGGQLAAIALGPEELDPAAVLMALRTGSLVSTQAPIVAEGATALAALRIRLTTDARGVGRILVFELGGPADRELRALLAEPR